MSTRAWCCLALLAGCHPVPLSDNCIDLGPDQPQVGFDAPFEVRVERRCAELIGGRVAWSQEGGAPLALQSSQDGFVLRGRTPAFATLYPGAVPLGVVPLSPASTGETTLVASWRGEDGSQIRRSLRIAAAARSGGLQSVALGHRLHLGGGGWQVVERPAEARAAVESPTSSETLEPDVSGRWRLADRAGHSLSLRVGRYDTTPLDCGRVECHPNAAAQANMSPMTSVLARGLNGAFGESYGPRCALGCHAVGEPGTRDGGFADAAQAMAWQIPEHGASGGWDRVPPRLRQLGGVGCTACHGPAAIPEPSGRWSILRADVCAVCHDAKPRYGHVAAWQQSRMAVADAAPETRGDPRCAACHTTTGFLASLGVRSLTNDWSVPESAAPIGIACATCHDPHGGEGKHALLRQVEVPAAFADASPQTRLCVRCHAPSGSGMPEASAAALWLGSGGLDARTGRALPGSAVHRAVLGGCMGCHAGEASTAGSHGTSHSFAVDRAKCRACHAREEPSERLGRGGLTVAARAARLWSSLGLADPRHPGRPPHAALAKLAAARRSAVYDLLLVLEDRAAGIHNAAYARALLDEAESVLAASR